MQRFFFDAKQNHDEGNLVKDLVFMLKPDPADDMGGITKDYFKSPPEAVSRFLNARNSVHLPDATDPSIIEHALRQRRTIRVLQLPGTIGKSQDLSTDENTLLSARSTTGTRAQVVFERTRRFQASQCVSQQEIWSMGEGIPSRQN